MSNKANGVNWSKKASAKQRRVNVIARLEKQLKSGVKVVKNSKENGVEKLTDPDVKRIQKELEILRQRV
jgi:tetrahydromethanopterin S-methyltransferase subunit F